MVLVKSRLGPAFRRASKGLSNVGAATWQPYISSLASTMRSVGLMDVWMAWHRLARCGNRKRFVCTHLSAI